MTQPASPGSVTALLPSVNSFSRKSIVSAFELVYELFTGLGEERDGIEIGEEGDLTYSSKKAKAAIKRFPYHA